MTYFNLEVSRIKYQVMLRSLFGSSKNWTTLILKIHRVFFFVIIKEAKVASHALFPILVTLVVEPWQQILQSILDISLHVPRPQLYLLWVLITY